MEPARATDDADHVDSAGFDSFPASDAPPWTPRVALGAPHHPQRFPARESTMPSIERPLASDALVFPLKEELAATHDP